MQPTVPAVTPTIGAVLGGLANVAIQSHVGDPALANGLMMLLPGLFAWAAHALHASFLNMQL